MAKLIRFLGLEVTAAKERCRQSVEGHEFPSETGRRAAARRWVACRLDAHARPRPHPPPSSLSLGRRLAELGLSTLDATSSQRKGCGGWNFPWGGRMGYLGRNIPANEKLKCAVAPSLDLGRKTMQGRRGWPLDAFPVCLAYFGVVQGTERHGAAAHQPDACDTRGKRREETGR